MSLTTTEEAQTRALIAQNAALLSLASSEPTIISKLGATKVSLADLTAATSLSSTDLFLVRQGTTEKSASLSVVTPDSSLTVKGLVELATSAETVAGVDAVRAVTPSGFMSGFVSSLAANGYQKLPSGLIIQWGSGSTAIGGTNFTFPIVFPNAVYTITATNAPQNLNVTTVAYSLAVGGFSAASYPYNSATSVASNITWIAIGR